MFLLRMRLFISGVFVDEDGFILAQERPGRLSSVLLKKGRGKGKGVTLYFEVTLCGDQASSPVGEDHR